MKRFYKQAASRPEAEKWIVELDGKPVRTPGGEQLHAPAAALADAICSEWNAQGEKVEARSMPLTRISNAAIDLVPVRRPDVVEEILRFGETDLLCYRATDPESLVARQHAEWQPVLDWLLRHHDVPLHVTAGIGHVEQPAQSLAVLRADLETMSDFQLAAMNNLVAILGSIVLALAVRDKAIDHDAAWQASILDELYQAEHWGDDDQAAARRAANQAEFALAARMLALLETDDG